jgi:RNA polymerase sigma factor (sigma-70 family)
MVWGVCRRLLRHEQDAEDAFQATFLVLSRKARSVVKRESVGGWLYRVAYHIALRARGMNLHRRARERQLEEMPEPEMVPAEPQDWRPILDRELERLPEKYRAALVLCDLEELPRREAARQLGVPEGTLSSRLATARHLLAKRLARYGLSVCGAVLVEGTVRAAVPARLVDATVRAAVSQSVSSTISLLTNGALKTMFMDKMRLVLGLVMTVGVFVATGLAYRAEGQVTAAAKPDADKPTNEVDALRKEVELLRLNLLVVLEKVRSQEAELRTFRGQAGKATGGAGQIAPSLGRQLAGPSTRGVAQNLSLSLSELAKVRNYYQHLTLTGVAPPDRLQEAESAMKALRSARDKEAERRAVEALEKALQKLKNK